MSDVSEPDAATAVAMEPASVKHEQRPMWNLLLFVATLATTTWAGAAHLGVDLLKEPSRWRVGAPYALALLAILGVHEFGHYVVARRRGITVSLPYFIPAPVYLGTFGAFIQMRGTLRDRASYFDVAIAGPLAGLVVALLALAVGLGAPASAPHGGLVPASSALFAGIYKLVGGGALDQQIVLGPLAFAGYLGLVVTALNLAPIGQLDGGHVAYALLGQQRAARLASAVIMLLLLAGLFYSRHYLMWALIAWFVAGSRHPRALDETVPIGAGRMLLGLFALGLLLAIVLPWPASGRP